MRLLGAESVTRRRTAVGSFGSDGRYTPGATTDTTVALVFQPNDGGTVSLPELGGQRTEAGRKAYCARSTLRALVEGDAGTLPDQVVVDSVAYEVAGLEPQRQILPHDKVILVALQETGETEQGTSTEAEDTETVLQALRTLIKTVSGLSDARVILAGQRCPKPDLPYATVSCLRWQRNYPEESIASTGFELTITPGGALADPVEAAFTWAGEALEAATTWEAGDTEDTVAERLGGLLAAFPDALVTITDNVIVVYHRGGEAVTLTASAGLTAEETAAESRGLTRTATLEAVVYGNEGRYMLAELLTRLGEETGGYAVDGEVQEEKALRGRGYIDTFRLQIARTLGSAAGSKNAPAPVLESVVGTLTLDSHAPTGDVTIPLDFEV